MQPTHTTKTIDGLLKWFKAKMLSANPEYQRGAVWTPAQKKRLVDSVLRGYPIPLIYLHHIKTEVEGAKREDFEVIDGQQRINALYGFKEGEFKLFDPVADEEEARFPSFIQEQECPWGGKDFDSLDPAIQKQFLETPLSVVMIETDIANEARDLFIRLQAGMPLNSQEKRDAWPGNFTEYVLKLGGKPLVARYPGHDFFKVVMKAKDQNRGEARQLAAQMVMLYLTRQETNGEKLCDINRDAIDTFYYKHLSFNLGSGEAKRFVEILDILTRLLRDGKRPKVIGHEAMHLVLLVDSLLDDYTKSWEGKFATAFDLFRAELAVAKSTRFDETPNEFWLRYGQWTRSNTDRADTIQRRHQFFVEKMHNWIKPVMKDEKRLFGPLEKELIYYRDKKRCQLPGCDSDVAWSDAEFHHVDEHAKGGTTAVDNGVLVHKACHPKGKAAVEFAEQFKLKQAAKAASTSVPPQAASPA